ASRTGADALSLHDAVPIGQAAEWHGLLGTHLLQGVQHAGATKRSTPGQKLVQDGAQGINISPQADLVGIARRLLGLRADVYSLRTTDHTTLLQFPPKLPSP